MSSDMARFGSDLSSDMAVTWSEVTEPMSLKSLAKSAVTSLWALCSAQALRFASNIMGLGLARSRVRVLTFCGCASRLGARRTAKEGLEVNEIDRIARMLERERTALRAAVTAEARVFLRRRIARLERDLVAAQAEGAF